jgi:phosphatidylglycerophosphate synthase
VEASLSPFYLLKTTGVFAAIMLIALPRLRAHHPFARFGPANQVTTIRALLVSAVAGFVGEPHAPGLAAAAAGISALATIMDGLDGWLARRTQMVSAFGARFDMEIDALLIQVLSILAWRYGKAGVWVLASGLLRYVFAAAGWVWSWLGRPLFPSIRRKAICVVQIVGLILTISPAVPWPASAGLAAVSLAALSYSFLTDTVWLWRRSDE